jgi:hypothetical protein
MPVWRRPEPRPVAAFSTPGGPLAYPARTGPVAPGTGAQTGRPAAPNQPGGQPADQPDQPGSYLENFAGGFPHCTETLVNELKKVWSSFGPLGRLPGILELFPRGLVAVPPARNTEITVST